MITSGIATTMMKVVPQASSDSVRGLEPAPLTVNGGSLVVADAVSIPELIGPAIMFDLMFPVSRSVRPLSIPYADARRPTGRSYCYPFLAWEVHHRDVHDVTEE